MILNRITVAAIFVGGLMSVACSTTVDDSVAAERTTLDNATIEPEGASYVVTGTVNGARTSIVASEVRIVDATRRQVSDLMPSAVKYRCYVCACGGGQCECTEIACPEP